ncbi:MAG: aromatic amino acid lyase, partial [Pedobacter sp.]|nr:aromatic amino acid lyase [Chitinophagaceae bacterium]
FMSYNYLPLDKKQLYFDQVKNLLDFEQLVSITFDAHEKILKCREYLDKKISYGVLIEGINLHQNEKIATTQIEQFQYNLLISNAQKTDNEQPTAIVKLMLMLKIKSLGYGYSGVGIDTVKRLMEMYNNGMLPVVYSDILLGDKSALSQLALPLIGLGDVYFKGEKMPSAKAMILLDWQPLKLKSKEAFALINGTQFTTAYGLFCLKNSEELVLKSDEVTVTSAAMANAIKDAYNYVLQVFMKEANTVTDYPLIFPDKDLIVSDGDSSNKHLILALQFLNNAISQLPIKSIN